MSVGKTHRVSQSAGNVTMPSRGAFAVVLKLMFVVLIVVVIGGVAAAQSYPLSEVEVRLVRTPHGVVSVHAVSTRLPFGAMAQSHTTAP
jgi:hypothetical protein